MPAPLRDRLCPNDPKPSPLLCATKDCCFRRLSVAGAAGLFGSCLRVFYKQDHCDADHAIIYVNLQFPTPITISFTSPSFLVDSHRSRCARDGQPVPNCSWISPIATFVAIDNKGDRPLCPLRSFKRCRHTPPPASRMVPRCGSRSLPFIWQIDTLARFDVCRR